MTTDPGWFSDLGLALERQGRLEEALASYDQAIKRQPDDFQALSNRGNVLKALGRIDEALASYDQALAINPHCAEALHGRGGQLQELGRTGEALADYNSALALNPDNASVLIDRGTALGEMDRLGEAMESYDRALLLEPADAEVLVSRGNILQRMNRLDEALVSYDRALELNPDLAEAFNNRGVVLKAVNRPDEALASYDQALRLSPAFVEAHNNRGVVLKEFNLLDDALASYDRALALDPGLVTVLNNRGNVLNELDRIDEALANYDRALALSPDDASACNGRGNVLKKLHLFDEAEQMFRRAILLNPDSAEAHCSLGSVLIDLGKSDQAETVLRRALALDPDFATALHNLGTALIKLDRSDEAEAVIRRAVALNPDLAEAHHNLGVALMELGRLTEARGAAERAIALAPLQPAYFRQLGEVRRYAADDRYFTALQALAENTTALSIDDQVQLHFALAKAHADIGRPEDEFRQLLAGHALKRAQIDYDEAAALGEIDRTRQVFTSEFMRASEGGGEPSSKPIFIVGMPRSGTTLVEQILASHPRVRGAGELTLFERAVRDLRPVMQEAPAYPETALHMKPEHFRELGARYLAGIQRLAPAASRVTDKLPTNFLLIGLIHLALPDAVIIHTVRDPVDTCISCFSRLFTEGNLQTHDLAELGRYYRHYKTLMAHWHRVLPPTRILDVIYEDTVADLEASARRILAHCGLPWDPRCLDFHLTERVVRTASATQVRRPIYTSSIGRWRAYEPFLAPLLAELSLSA
jgi:tetratricopeptide (TPR) repeat protein